MTLHNTSLSSSAMSRRTVTADALKKYQAIFRMIHERRARTIFGLSGALVMLPMAVQAQAAEQQALDSIEGVVSHEVQPDGSVRVTLSNGQTVILAENAVTVAADGSLLVSDLAASELTAASEVAFGTGGLEGLGGGAAAGGGLLLAMAAGGGGGGDSAQPISKTITVVDAPLENALVFYDSNLDGTAQESEYLGLTDANGGINVEYTPVSGGKFIILPSPGPDGETDYGWSSTFADQFDDVQTYDVVTGNIFDNALQLNDNGETGEQVASPLSTLVASGAMTEDEVKTAFGIDENTELDTFNFFENLNSTDPDVQAAAKKTAAAAVIANQIAKSAVAAASTSGTLTEAQKQAVVTKAMTDAGKVLKALPAGTPVEDATSAASAVAVAGALNPDIDTDAMSSNITTAITNGGTASDAVATEVDAQKTGGALSDGAANAVNSTSTKSGESAKQIDDLFQGDTTSPTFAQQLDEADDAASEGVQEAINEELLGIVLVKDTNAITEGSVTFAKGNVLVNDKFEDGSALPSTTGIYSINGTVISGIDATEGSNHFVMSTSDWYTFSGSKTVSRGSIASELGLQASDFPATYPTNGSATRGSAITTTITVEAGDTLTFDYTFMSYDYVPYTDYSFVGLRATSGGTSAEQSGFIDELFGVDELKGTSWYNLAGVPTSASDTYTYTFDQAGTFELAVGVIDALDTIVDSYLWVSDVTVGDGTELGTSAVGDWDELGNTAQTEEVDTSVVATVVTGYYGTLVITKSGDYVYQVGGANAEPIPEGVVVTDDFTYKIEMEDGTVATQKLSIKVTGIADPEPEVPTLQLTVTDVNADTAEAASISGTTTNVDENEEVEISISDGVSTPLEITATVDADGNFSTTADLSSLNDSTSLTYTVSYDNGTTEVSTSASAVKDTTADAGGDFTVTMGSQTSEAQEFTVTGLDTDAIATVTLSDGTKTVTEDVAENGTFSFDLTGFTPGTQLSASFSITDVAGNSTSGDLNDIVPVLTVYNVGTGTGYSSLSAAIADATAGDTLQLAGVEFDESVTIDKPLTLLGEYANTAAFTDADTLAPEGRGEDESVITGTVTIAAADVTLNGLKLDNFDEPLTWDESILDGTPGGLDGFSLLNTVITTYAADGSPTFNANSDAQRGLYTGDTVASDWTISGNLIGGVFTSADSYGGAMYLSGLANSDISGNMFWRPGGGHLYMSSLTDTTIDGNFFYHGVHAGGVDFDGYAEMFEDGSYGYGYGYGYGSGGNAAPQTFFGRNFWIELKGTNDGVSITDNDGAYNSGGIQLYGENAGYSFANITISGNNFEDFINADPNGVLEGAAYYQSGFMGAISVSISEGSTAEGIVITENVISAAIDQIFSVRDQSALIAVTGIVDGVEVSSNTLTWTTSSTDILTALDALNVPASSYAGAVSGLLLAGGLSGEVLVSTNDFNGADGIIADGSPAIYVVGEVEGFGAFMAQLGESGNNFDDWDEVEMFITQTTEAVDLGEISLEAQEVYLGVDVDGTPGDDIFYLFGGMGVGNDTFTGTAGNDFFYVGNGSDTVDISQGGNDLILIDATADADGGDTVTGFSVGEPGVGGDTFVLMGLDQSALRGTGEYVQSVESGDTVDADTGLLVFSNALTDTPAGTLSSALENALDSLSGLNEGDEFYVLADFVSAGQDATLINVTAGAGGTYETEFMTEFEGLTAASFSSGSQFNTGNFQGLPEV